MQKNDINNLNKTPIAIMEAYYKKYIYKPDFIKLKLIALV